MSERDELAKLLFITDNHSPDAEQDWLHLKPYGPKYLRGYYDEADAILAAGYTKPRTITTAEERAELKPGTIAADVNGNAWKRGTGSWVGTGDLAPLFDHEDLTLTVIYTPEES